VAASLRVTEGQAGGLITAYALAIVIGGPILTLWLARFEKRAVLIGLMALFIAGNLIAALTSNYSVLLVSRVIAGLTQGHFSGSAPLWRSSSFPTNSPAGRWADVCRLDPGERARCPGWNVDR